MEPIRTIVVEDSPQILKVLVKLLESRSEIAFLGAATSGEEGLELAERVQPQVMVLDLELPGMNGIEVTRKIKVKVGAPEVLILTTFDDEQKVFEAVQAGASGYLVKRVAGEKIIEGIVEVFGGGTVIESRIAKRFWNYFSSVQGKPPEKQDFGLIEVELEVLRYLAKGLSNAEVGSVMAMERRTVRTHLGHIYEKLGVASHVDAVVKAVKAGLIEIG
jgi:DNA-binding NarL/FixJ family response regulator